MPAVAPLSQWGNFYVLVGTSAATLTGLMFVVITLIAARRAQLATGDVISTFSTPTVVHYCVALGVGAVLSAPWPALGPAGLLLGLCGLAGMGYSAMVVRRLRRQESYSPVLEDWLFHVVFPLVAYVALLGAAVALVGTPSPALFAAGTASVVLLLIGIHNAWDAVTYLIIARVGLPSEDRE